MNQTLQLIEASQKQFFVFVGLVLLVIPKVNIISLSSYSGAGLRVDDLLLLLTLSIFIFISMNKEWTLNEYEVNFFIFLSIGIISVLLNSLYGRGSILYVLRLLEYWVFFYLGSFIKDIKFLNKFLIFLVLINGLVITLQYFNIIGGFANGVYTPNISRPTGLTNGAYEVPMLIAISFSFLLNTSKTPNSKIFLYYIVSSFLIILTSARIPLFAINLVFLIYLMKNLTPKTKLIFFPTLLLCILFIMSGGLSNNNTDNESNITSRFTSLFHPELFYTISKLVKDSPEEKEGVIGAKMKETQLTLKTNKSKENFVDESKAGADLSFMIRMNKWLWATKTYLKQNIIYIFWGLAPGSMGNALDGGLLRILLETGIFGFIAFMYFLYIRPRSKKNDPMLSVIITFLLGNLFIDYYLSYKVMALYLLLLGATSEHIKINKKSNAT